MTSPGSPQEGRQVAGDGDAACSAVDGGRLVFIGGLHRSGTSLVHRCLGDHPHVSAFRDTGVPEDEGQHLQSVYTPAHLLGGAGRFGFHPAAAMDEQSPLVTPQNSDRLYRDWARYWDVDRQVLIEKSPPNLVRTRFLQALFPGCRFVIVQRHPIAVAAATRKWFRGRRAALLGRSSYGALIAHWLVCYERFAADRGKLQNVFVLRYEDFVAEPQRYFDALTAFLGLQPCRIARDIRADVNEGYFAAWEQRTERGWGRLYARLLAKRFEHRVRQLGYSLRHHRAAGS